jgi:hypothetical protein
MPHLLRQEGIMEKKIKDLIDAAKALLKYENYNDIYDEYAYDGEVYVDTWMSFELFDLFQNLEKAVNKF